MFRSSCRCCRRCGSSLSLLASGGRGAAAARSAASDNLAQSAITPGFSSTPWHGERLLGIRRYLAGLPCVSRSVILALMAKAISVRLDDDAERALRLLESTGLSRSEAIRSSLLASADRMRRRKQLAAEVAALEADAADRSEMLEVASLMESLRAAG